MLWCGSSAREDVEILHAKRRDRNRDSFSPDRLQALLQKGGEIPAFWTSVGMSDASDKSVLVVEDDAATAGFLADNLRADGYRVFAAAAAAEAVRAVEVRQPDLMLLDLGLAAGSGLEVLDRVRAADASSARFDPDMPVIVLTGRSGEIDRVRGFARGADDYLCKPFSYPELVARVEAVLRRAAGRRLRGVIRVGELTVDPSTRVVRLGGREVELSAKEFALLHALAADPVRVVPKPELLRDVWGYASVGVTRTVDAHACRLRKKLGGGGRRYVVNVRGVGYRLTEAP
jgi:DNA-binding response OmpR family regulator